MKNIIGNIVNCLHDDNQFHQILEVNAHKGFIHVKELSTNTEYKIVVQKVEEHKYARYLVPPFDVEKEINRLVAEGKLESKKDFIAAVQKDFLSRHTTHELACTTPKDIKKAMSVCWKGILKLISLNPDFAQQIVDTNLKEGNANG